ncbi:MAG TPA: acyl-CoA synthetase [Dehalococcoidia bacterium]|nr:acyl-CoA synthetase [Dehalococcoidia bacterium]
MEFNLADLFECVADAVPDREALVHGDRRLTFAQLDQRANRLAHHFLAAGIRPGDHIGLYLYSCAEYIEAALAAFKVRAAPVNINFRYVEDELRYLFDDADLAAVVYHREFAPRVAAVAPAVASLRTFVAVDDGTPPPHGRPDDTGYEAALAAASPARDFAPRSGDDLYLLYTGGTTGMPKGVMWRQEDMFFGGLQGGNPGGPDITRPEEIGENAARNAAPPCTLPVAPLMHGNGHWAAIIGMNSGGKVVIATSHRLDPHEIWTLVGKERVNVLSIVGDAMGRPLAEALAAPGAAYDTLSLVVISSGGAIFSEAVKQQLRASLPTTLLIDALGASEVGHSGMNLGANETGRPRFTVDPNSAVLGEDLRPVVPGSGVVGMVARRGRMPIGYYKDPVKTAATFVTDPDGVRWVVPGDRATVEADGTVTLLGRGSVCINSGGEKIYPEEVESALKSHAAIFDAVVVGVPDERWGERVAAVVQLRPGHALTLAELDAYARTKVSGYKVPRLLTVVDEVFRSPSGKADYKWAKARAIETQTAAAGQAKG